MYIQGNGLTNALFKKRFGVKDSLIGSISRLINDTVSQKTINLPEQEPRHGNEIHSEVGIV